MKKHTNTYPQRAGLPSYFLNFFSYSSFSFLICLGLTGFTASAQQTIPPIKNANRSCTIVEYDVASTKITPSGNNIPGSTPIKFTIRICNWGNCVANDIELTFRMPKKFTNMS
ncbi:MAG: hypothetical protein ACOYOA_06995 [Saprospiraceae bacterium]